MARKKVSIFASLMFFCAFLQAQEVPEFFDQAFLVFAQYCKDQKFDEERYIQVSQALPKPYSEYTKTISTWLQKHKRDKKSTDHFNQMRAFLDFLRQHKLFFKACEFYNAMEAKYVYAFDNAQVIDAITRRSAHEYPLVYFLDDWQDDYNTVHVFEDRLHSRYGITKAKNYALKIELLRIRNNIIFKDEYKDQSWQYKKRHWYHMPYKIIRGIGHGLKEFGVYLGHVFTGPSLGA